MAELTIRPDEIRDALADFVRAYEPDEASRQEVGTVAECGDGIARVEGLPSAMANELLEFPGGIAAAEDVFDNDDRAYCQRHSAEQVEHLFDQRASRGMGLPG